MQDTKKHLGSSFCTDFHCDNTTEEDGRFLRTFCQDKIFAFVNNTKRKTKGFLQRAKILLRESQGKRPQFILIWFTLLSYLKMALMLLLLLFHHLRGFKAWKNERCSLQFVNINGFFWYCLCYYDVTWYRIVIINLFSQDDFGL